MALQFSKGINAVEEDPSLDHECTSWIVFSDLTKNNTNILHKNRDAKARNVTALKSSPESLRKWIGLGNDLAVCMGVNASGLAGAMNSGELTCEPSLDATKKGTPALLKVILESCDTASQAVKELHRLILDEKDYWHQEKGSIFFFLDLNEGFICEVTAKRISVMRYESGYEYRANCWKNPGMAQYSLNSQKGFLDSCGREYMVRLVLNKALQEKGSLGVSDMLELARTSTMPEDSPLGRSVCYLRTNSSSSLVIHREYPGVLSTAYCCIGHVRHTVCIPIPICAEEFTDFIGTPESSDLSWKRMDALGLYEAIPEKVLSFEKSVFCRYEKASEEALALLRQGKKSQAVTLLNDTARQIWIEAEKLQKEE